MSFSVSLLPLLKSDNTSNKFANATHLVETAKNDLTV